MKKFLKLVPALCMLLISAMVLGTSTYAWFSMSNTVTATDMKVRAKAESGIVIRNAKSENGSVVYNSWANSSPAQYTAAVELIPTSTADLTNWYHNSSDIFDSAKPDQVSTSYANVGTIAATERTDTYTNAYYACYKYYIKVADYTALTVTSLDVNRVTVTLPATQQSAELNKALRVGIVMDAGDTGTGTFTAIYAPVTGATASYHVAGSNTTTTALGPTTKAQNTGITTIPVSDTALSVYVYIWFEGEDAACKSSNLTATLDDIVVDVEFGYTE